MWVTDRQVMCLLRMWLASIVEETDDQGRTQRTRPRQGTPQGGVISPLLANQFQIQHTLIPPRRRSDRQTSLGRVIIKSVEADVEATAMLGLAAVMRTSAMRMSRAGSSGFRQRRSENVPDLSPKVLHHRS